MKAATDSQVRKKEKELAYRDPAGESDVGCTFALNNSIQLEGIPFAKIRIRPFSTRISGIKNTVVITLGFFLLALFCYFVDEGL